MLPERRITIAYILNFSTSFPNIVSKNRTKVRRYTVNNQRNFAIMSVAQPETTFSNAFHLALFPIKVGNSAFTKNKTHRQTVEFFSTHSFLRHPQDIKTDDLLDLLIGKSPLNQPDSKERPVAP